MNNRIRLSLSAVLALAACGAPIPGAPDAASGPVIGARCSPSTEVGQTMCDPGCPGAYWYCGVDGRWGCSRPLSCPPRPDGAVPADAVASDAAQPDVVATDAPAPADVLVGPACTSGVGACARTGVIRVNDAGIPVCTNPTNSQPVTPGAPATETCDGVDNDCDGRVDNIASSAAPLTRSCGGNDVPDGVGQCRRGTQTCASGAWSTICVGLRPPTAEICNGIDDDCDGQIDNNCRPPPGDAGVQ